MAGGDSNTLGMCCHLDLFLNLEMKKIIQLKRITYYLYPLQNGVTEYSDENRGGNKRKDDLSSYKLAYPNDIVLNSMNVIVGAVGVSKYFGAIRPCVLCFIFT
ncbi:Probable type I restriction modification system, specificity component HsdS2 [Haemophilus influenzae]|uniref:Probable type I restriction modification system, specificity component HsdS2 n=1 Tax=Haemophilus influenzae TaxID=727 RepID=A0A2X1PVB9_HAEIF|nr:Probable type I restriction modification system, specificity component HsdS2 [Haemophilus influenzae]